MARLPVLTVHGESMPEAWENSILTLAEKGLVYKREDEEDSGDQIDSYMTIDIQNPDADPFSHLKGGVMAVDQPFIDYCYEMMGSKSSWTKDKNDPEDTKWEYLYHTRLAQYPTSKGTTLNQIEFAKQRLSTRPYSRRNNIITWNPEQDTIERHTPCLQRLWFNIIPRQNGERDSLETHYNFRSNNVMNASFGNMLGLYVVGCDIRDVAEKELGKELDMRMIHNVDSYHVNSREYPGFLKNVENIKKSIAEGNGLEGRSLDREMIIDVAKNVRRDIEDDTMQQTEKYFKGDLDIERKRVEAIGDRIFYLLDKYAPGKR